MINLLAFLVIFITPINSSKYFEPNYSSNKVEYDVYGNFNVGISFVEWFINASCALGIIILLIAILFTIMKFVRCCKNKFTKRTKSKFAFDEDRLDTIIVG